jgi:hypothetical protein
MTVTYDLTTDIGKIRLIIGDKIIATPVFTDEELQVFLTTEGSVNLGSAAALEAWAASYGANADNERIGDYSYSQNIIKNLLDLAARLRGTAAGIPAMDIASMNLTGIVEEP